MCVCLLRGTGGESRGGGGGNGKRAKLARGSDETSTGRESKRKPEGQRIHLGLSDTPALVSKTDS